MAKVSVSETLTRMHRLVKFLAEREEKGARLEEILHDVYADYAENKNETRKKMFQRDRANIMAIYSDSCNFHNDREISDDEDDVKIEYNKKRDRYFLKTKFPFMLTMRLTEAQAQAMVVGTKLAGHFITPIKESANSTWLQLKKKLAPHIIEKADRLGNAIALSLPISNLDKGQELFQKAVRAIDEKKVLHIREYEDMKGFKAPRFVSPYALYFKYHAWYLLGASPTITDQTPPGIPAPFRLNRMNLVEVMGDGDFIDCPYSPEELQENIALDFHPSNPDKNYHIKLRITDSFAKASMQTTWFRDEKKKTEKDGSVSYEVTLKGLEAITLWIMRGLDCIEVLEPQELVDEIDRRVKKYTDRKNRN